jgi:hypothetical protein
VCDCVKKVWVFDRCDEQGAANGVKMEEVLELGSCASH